MPTAAVLLVFAVSVLVLFAPWPSVAKSVPECAVGGVRVAATSSPATITVANSQTGRNVDVQVTITGAEFRVESPGLFEATWCLKASTQTRSGITTAQSGFGSVGVTSDISNKSGVAQAIGYVVLYSVKVGPAETPSPTP